MLEKFHVELLLSNPKSLQNPSINGLNPCITKCEFLDYRALVFSSQALGKYSLVRVVPLVLPSDVWSCLPFFLGFLLWNIYQFNFSPKRSKLQKEQRTTYWGRILENKREELLSKIRTLNGNENVSKLKKESLALCEFVSGKWRDILANLNEQVEISEEDYAYQILNQIKLIELHLAFRKEL